jgi:hypothetical protein
MRRSPPMTTHRSDAAGENGSWEERHWTPAASTRSIEGGAGVWSNAPEPAGLAQHVRVVPCLRDRIPAAPLGATLTLSAPEFAAWTPRLADGVPGVKKRRQALNSQRGTGGPLEWFRTRAHTRAHARATELSDGGSAVSPGKDISFRIAVGLPSPTSGRAFR